jgi:putative addiction module killer protein
MYEIEDYVTPDGRDIFSEWFLKLKDRKAKQHVERRLSYIEQCNFGDQKFCQDGVWELRIDVGPGYRIYYGLSGTTIVMLLCGGDKSSQSRDIDRLYLLEAVQKGERRCHREATMMQSLKVFTTILSMRSAC